MSSNNLQAFSNKLKTRFGFQRNNSNTEKSIIVTGSTPSSVDTTSNNNQSSASSSSQPALNNTSSTASGQQLTSKSSSCSNLQNTNGNSSVPPLKPPLEIVPEFYQIYDEHQESMEFYKKAEKKLVDLKKTSLKMIEKEQEVASLFVDGAGRLKSNRELSDTLRKFGNNLKSTSTLLSQAMTKLDDFKEATATIREDGKNVVKFRNKYESAKNEYESFKLDTPRVNPDKDGFSSKPNENGEYDPQYVERTKKVEEDFKQMAKNLNTAYSDYHNELDFQIAKRDGEYFSQLKSFIYAYYCYFSTGMALFEKLDNIVKKQEEEIHIETSKSNGTRNVVEVPKHVFPHITADRKTIFGAPLEQVMIQDYDSGILRLPPSIQQLFDLIREYGLDQEGVFRVNSDEQYMKKLILDIEMGKPIEYLHKSYFVPSVAGILKLFIRELQEPLMTFEAFSEIIQCPEMQIQNDPTVKEQQIDKLKQFINNKVPIHFQVVLYELLKLLHEVAQQEEKNKMHANNLALIFSMNLFRPRLENAVQLAQNVKHMSYVTCLLIENFTALFDNSLKKVCDTQVKDPYESIRKSISEKHEEENRTVASKSVEVTIVNFTNDVHRIDTDGEEDDDDDDSETSSNISINSNSSPLLTFSDLPTLHMNDISSPKQLLDKNTKYQHKHITSEDNISLILKPAKDQSKQPASPRIQKLSNNVDKEDDHFSLSTDSDHTIQEDVEFSSNVTPTLVSDARMKSLLPPQRRLLKRVEKKNKVVGDPTTAVKVQTSDE
ncbi:hypothetical protein C9374_013408 [Naegleria lovaniensis]|uniref:Rho-GAP domain-containing protein n=1 Tax=Naegleria lovaniensis TaxID=51637 RepID=A0AA88GVQ4_NAELO|nr:uncharacterized protein C9374_013408 [Naegleria lovaniensis]KAG2391923.1 hypothetical protein C9374_013408 [Naegleria lovaniensis]